MLALLIAPAAPESVEDKVGAAAPTLEITSPPRETVGKLSADTLMVAFTSGCTEAAGENVTEGAAGE